MKKITLLLIFLLFSSFGFSQLALEGFESTTGPDALPSTNWTLSTGNWAVFDNGIGLGQRWTTNTTNVCAGTQTAYANREFIEQGNTSEDYLATPLTLIPTNGELHFTTRLFTPGNQGTLYQIKVATATASQTNTAAYTLVQQYTEVELNAVFNLCEEKIVNLSAFAGQQVYVAFVKIFTQPTDALSGDRWLLDNVSINEKCLAPTALTFTDVTQNSANLSWANPSGATSWEIEVIPALGTPSGVGIIFNGTLPFTVTGLLSNTSYKYCVRALCTTGYISDWVCSTTNFTTTIAPPICGGNYVDVGGTTDNYPNDSDSIVTICPVNAGDLVTVTFTAFTTEAEFDGLYVFDGNSITASQIESTNDGGFVPGGIPGSFWGGTIPGPFTSSSADGCLTFRFISDGFFNTTGWQANITCNVAPTCLQPNTLVTSSITDDGVFFDWNQNGVATAWQVLVLPCFSPPPTAASTGWIDTSVSSITIPGLDSVTCYDLYVRGICTSSDISNWAGPKSFTTLATPPVCGGNFVDDEGPIQNYANDSDSIVTICPVNATDVVTVTFTSFDTEQNWDALYVFDGNQITDIQISSTNDGGNVPGGQPGGYWGTEIPGPFTSSSADGCLTFRFISDGFVNNPGWIANVTCALAPTCPRPNALIITDITFESLSLGWNELGTATEWNVLVLPCGSPPPTAASTGFEVTSLNPFPISGLDASTCYDIYVRSVCSVTDISNWSIKISITTPVQPPVCGGNFYDDQGPIENYINDTNSTVTICPTIAGQQVTVTFTTFETDEQSDGLYVFDGNSTAASQVTSVNGSGFVPGGLPGSFWGTEIPGPFTSSSVDGCLTFRFISDGFGNGSGWQANVTCNPAPTCPRPTALLISNISQTGASVSWTEVGTATLWEVLVLPAGSPLPNAASTGVLTTTIPYLIPDLNSGTQYVVYVRAICSSTDSSNWSYGSPLTTLIENDECINATQISINPDTSCTLFSSGTVTGATSSNQANDCFGSSDDDVWFSFVATAVNHSIDLTNINGSTTDIQHVLYSGTCGALTQLSCNFNTQSIGTNLTLGATYFIRVYSLTDLPNQTTSFNICIGTLPPPIITNTTTYTTQQLVENVLLNSTCATVSNITSSTGTNFGSVNGIGYFNQNGTTFPYGDGLVLSTGDALNAPGPNSSVLGDGGFDWTGDAELEAIILAGTGVPMISQNATKLEFDFIPLINEINFNFVFASEEYGFFQCDFSDAFAFLLTDLNTGVTTNLAVITNNFVPISVVTIRNQIYHPNPPQCSSVNPEYFDTFYGINGENPLGAPINFNGITVPLTATSAVIPGNQYHIKLVIADRQDTNFDSSVYIEGGSFDIGNIELGEDFLQATNNAICFGTSYTIETGLNPTLFTFSWTLNGATIPNETGPNLIINQGGVYGAITQYINTTCVASDSITIEYYDLIVAGTPNDLLACNNTGIATFDLIQNNSAALGNLNPSEYSVTYYLTNADAIADINQLTNNYTTITNPQTIFVRVENNLSGCFTTNQFNLIVNPEIVPTFNLPTLICQNDIAPLLPLLSDNGISGTWSPSIVSNLQTSSYIFTPDGGLCIATIERVITVNPLVQPTFSLPAPICLGDVAPELPLTSSNGITGTWFPSIVDNTQTLTYTFTPNSGQCSEETSLSVTILQDCSFGSFANAVWLTNCATSNFFNTVGSGTDSIGPIENVFPNADLGTYLQNSNTLILRGAELKTFKTTTANVCSARLNYRIYPQSETPGAFTVLDLPFFDDCTSGTFPSGGPCSTGDQKWQRVLNDTQSPINLTTYPAGNYVIEVYYDVTGDVTSTAECDDIILINNNGANFIANYTIQENPTYIFTNPTSCGASDGTIVINDLAPSTTYTVTYTDDTVNVTALTITSNNAGQYIITGLNAGLYANFNYQVNSCTFTSTDVITLIDTPTTPTFNTIPPICAGDILSPLPTSSIEGIQGTWSPALNNLATTTYTFTPNPSTTTATNLIVNGNFSQGNTAFTTDYQFILNAGLNGVQKAYGIVAAANSWFQFFPACTSNAPSAGNMMVVDGSTTNAGNDKVWEQSVVVQPNQNYIFSYWLQTIAIPNPAEIEVTINGISIGMTTAPTTNCQSGQYSYTWNSGTNTTALVTMFDRIITSGGNDFSIDDISLIESVSNNPCATTTELTIVVNQLTTATFNPISVCFGSTTANFPTTSIEGFTGAWSPNTIDTTQPANYTFTPTAGQCAGNGTLAILITPQVLPTFAFGTALTACQGDVSAQVELANISSNGINGIWTPSTIDYSIIGETVYTFTPDSTQCASTTILTVTITQRVTPTFSIQQVQTICSGAMVPILTNLSSNGINGTWNPAIVSNTETLIYTFTPASGTCANQYQIEVIILPNVVPIFNYIEPLCQGAIRPVLPAISSNGISGTWLPPIVNNTSTQNYTFTPNAGECAVSGQLTIEVLDPLIMEIDEECIAENYTLEISNTNYDVNTATFLWQNSASETVGSNTSSFDVTTYLNSTPVIEQLPLTFSVTVTTLDGCSGTRPFVVEGIFCGIQKGISPNNDTLNDFLDLSLLGVKKLEIFNRYGTKAYSKSGYTNQWVGQSDKGDELPDGTYYYVIEFNNGQETKTGWIYINREL